MERKPKITFKELSFWLKVYVVVGWIWIVYGFFIVVSSIIEVLGG